MARVTARLGNTRNLERELRLLGNIGRQPSFVKVGLPKDSMNYPDGTSLIMVGAVHEFGTRDGRVPERSYLRTTSKELTPEVKKFWRKNAVKILTGKVTAKRLLGIIGLQFQAAVQEKITDIKEPALAPSTMRKRLEKVANVGGDVESPTAVNPLVDTGHLRQSIRFEISKNAN